MVFAAAASRRMEWSNSALSFPFAVKQVAVGYGSAAQDDEAKKEELWMPLWNRPARLAEVRRIFSEGRAQINGRQVRNGIDFARAIASLGIDRGISEFQRYGFFERNGQAYFATPLNRFRVRLQNHALLIQEIDIWLDRFRRCAMSKNDPKKNPPRAALRALRSIEESVIALCQHGDALRVQVLLVELGRCERFLASRLKWVVEENVPPVPLLSSAWLDLINDGSVEFRLAAALASRRTKNVSYQRGFPCFRERIEPVAIDFREIKNLVNWKKNEQGASGKYQHGAVIDILNTMFSRELIESSQANSSCWLENSACTASVSDVNDFIEGRIDDSRFWDLLWGCLLIDWDHIQELALHDRRSNSTNAPDALYAILKLCYAGKSLDEASVPIVPRIHRLAASGRGVESSRYAAQRLRASGLIPATSYVSGRDLVSVKRVAAALVFPLSTSDLYRMRRYVLRRDVFESISNVATY